MQWVISILECERIGREKREQEAAAWPKPAVSDWNPFGIGPVEAGFTGWTDAFAKFGFVTQAFLNLARKRGDVWAAAYLEDVRDALDRAQSRFVTPKEARVGSELGGNVRLPPFVGLPAPPVPFALSVASSISPILRSASRA